MLRDAGLIDDVEHEIYRYLPIRDCKSLLLVSTAASNIALKHLLTREQKYFPLVLENQLGQLALTGLFATFMQPIDSTFFLRHPKNKPSLSLFILIGKIFTSSHLQPTLLNQLTVILRDASVAKTFNDYFQNELSECKQLPENKMQTALSNILETGKTSHSIEIEMLQHAFAHASTEQLNYYFNQFKHSLKNDRRLILALLIPYLSNADQMSGLDLLKKSLFKKFDGAILFTHIQDISNKLAKHVSSKPIISYLAFIWDQLLLFETSDEYKLEKSKCLASMDTLEETLPHLPIPHKRKIFLHYSKQKYLANITEEQFVRRLRRLTLLAPVGCVHEKHQLLNELCKLIDDPTPFVRKSHAFQGLCTLVGNLSGTLRHLTLAKYFARLPTQPFDTYFLSFINLSKHLHGLIANEYLEHAHAEYVNLITQQSIITHTYRLSELVILLIQLATQYAPAIEIAFNCWRGYINITIETRRATSDDTTADSLLPILDKLPLLAILLPPAKRRIMLALFNQNLTHPDFQIKRFMIQALAELSYFLDSDAQATIMETLWNMSITDADDNLKNEAKCLLGKMAIRLTNPEVQTKLTELLQAHPEPTTSSMVQSLIKRHTLFFQSSPTIKNRESYAHSTPYHHA